MTVQPDMAAFWRRHDDRHKPGPWQEEAVQAACKPLSDEIERLTKRDKDLIHLVAAGAVRETRLKEALDAIANLIGHPTGQYDHLLKANVAAEIARVAHTRNAE